MLRRAFTAIRLTLVNYLFMLIFLINNGPIKEEKKEGFSLNFELYLVC